MLKIVAIVIVWVTVSASCLCVGPIEQLPDYNRVRGNMYWART